MTETIPEKIDMQSAGQTREILLQRENKKDLKTMKKETIHVQN